MGAAPVVATGKAAARRDSDTEVGSTIEADDDEHGPRGQRSSRSVLVAVLAIIALLGVAVIVLIGYLNSGRYLLACESERAVPEQGRGFPPWGARALAGDAWRPLPIAAATRCQPLETDDVLVLQRAFLAMVLDQATAQLTAHEVTKVDGAEALLKQALLLTRPAEHESDAAAKQRDDQHQDVERLLGDVAYWRAAAKVRDATAALGDAARQFDSAVSQHARHASDAGAWAAYVRRLAQEINAGPAGAAPIGSGAVNAIAGGPAGSPSPGAVGVGAVSAGSPGAIGAGSASAGGAGAGSARAGSTIAVAGNPTGAGSGSAASGAAGSTGAGSGAASAAGVPSSSPTSTPANGPSERTPAPPGAAVPVEPARPSPPPARPAAPPDAGASNGGVLL